MEIDSSKCTIFLSGYNQLGNLDALAQRWHLWNLILPNVPCSYGDLEFLSFYFDQTILANCVTAMLISLGPIFWQNVQ